MQPAKFVVTAVLASLVLFALGGTLYGVVFSEFFATNTGSAVGVPRESPELAIIYCGELASATLLTLVLGGWARLTDFGSAAKGGLAVGLLMTTAFDLVVYGTTHMMNLQAVMLDIPLNAARFALVGGLIGWWLGRGR